MRKAAMCFLALAIGQSAQAQVQSFSGTIPSWTLYWTIQGELMLEVQNATITTINGTVIKAPISFAVPVIALEPAAAVPQVGSPALIKLGGTQYGIYGVYSEITVSGGLSLGIYSDGVVMPCVVSGYDFSWFGYGGMLGLDLFPASGRIQDIENVLAGGWPMAVSGSGYFDATLSPDNRMISRAPWWEHSFIPRRP